MPTFIRALQNHTMRNADDGSGGGGAPDMAALIAAEVAKAVGGLKAKNDELLNEVKAERQKRQAIESRITSLGGEGDIEKARELMSSMQADADLRMIVEGGKTAFDEVVGRRTKGVIEAEKRRAEAAENAALEAAKARDSALDRWRNERLATGVNSAVMKAKALPEAADYIRMEAERLFMVDDESGSPTFREGKEIIDRSGNPHTLDTWVESLRDVKPFFFGIPQGGGANGSGAGSGGNRGPLRIDPKDTKALSQNLEAIASGKAVINF